jgi:hypothetical protein
MIFVENIALVLESSLPRIAAKPTSFLWVTKTFMKESPAAWLFKCWHHRLSGASIWNL